MEKTKKPAIRFDGFTEDWERRPLSDYLQVSNEKNQELRFSKDDVLSVSGDYGIVNQIAFKGRSFAGESVENYGVVHTGDVVYTKSPLKANPYGIIKANKGPAGIVSTLYAVYHSKENVNSSFVQTYFEQHARMNSYMNPLVNKGAKNDMKVSAENALKGLVIFPEIDEQKRIVHQFEDLDNCVSIAQQKYDKLLTFKKSMLEKMFPQDGAKEPEVRFAGFDGEWESHPLNEIADRIIEKNIGCGITETFTNSAEYGVISQRDFFDHDISNKANLGNYYIVKDNDFVYNPRISVTAPCGPINRNKLGRTGVMSPLYTVFRTHDIDNEYLEWYFKSHYWFSFMRYNGDSGARSDRFSIKNDLFFQMPIPVPKIEEQKKIGAFLKSLDELVSLYGTELEKLKNIKSALLEKMFV